MNSIAAEEFVEEPSAHETRCADPAPAPDGMTKPQSVAIPQKQGLPPERLARYDRLSGNILQPREFANRRRSAVMTGFPFQTAHPDPFKAQPSRKDRKKAKRMPKGITPPISDPFHVSAPAHAQLYFDPLRSKSSRAKLSASADVRSLTAAAAASAQARIDRRPSIPAATFSETPSDAAPVHEPDLREREPILAEFSEAEETDTTLAPPVSMAADGHQPGGHHPHGPTPSTRAGAYYAQSGRSGGGGNGGGSGGNGAGGGPPAKVDPVQDDIVAGVLVAAMAVLFGWAGYNALAGSGSTSDDGEPLLSPQSLSNATTQIEDLTAPRALPPGPIDIRPSSPIETQADLALPTQLQTVAEPEALELAQIETQAQAPSEAAAPSPPTCAPGRAMRAYFCTASANLTPTARSALIRELDDWGACAASNDLVVRGYADTRGSSTMNAGLAASRAGSVAAMLRERGYSVTEVVGVGELSDIEDERNCSNQRRVDVGIKGDPPPANLSCAPPREAQSLICA